MRVAESNGISGGSTSHFPTPSSSRWRRHKQREARCDPRRPPKAARDRNIEAVWFDLKTSEDASPRPFFLWKICFTTRPFRASFAARLPSLRRPGSGSPPKRSVRAKRGSAPDGANDAADRGGGTLFAGATGVDVRGRDLGDGRTFT